MDFHALIAKINTINNAPATPSTRQITQESEFPMMGNASAPVGGPLSPPPHPSMHVNIDAQGVDNIEDIFRLMQKLNPDMDQTKRLSTPLPTPISPIPGTTDFDDDMDDINADLDLHSSMDDDLDSEMDDVDSEMDDVDSEMDDELDHKMHELDGDLDSDGDIDNDDLEGDDEIILGGSFDSSTDEDGGFQSSTTRPSSRYRDMDYMNDELAGGMNGPKKTYPKVAGGDNPMQSMDESRSRFYEAIRSDLRSRLAETKKSSVDAIKKAKLDISKKAKATKAKAKSNMEESRLTELDAQTLANYNLRSAERSRARRADAEAMKKDGWLNMDKEYVYSEKDAERLEKGQKRAQEKLAAKGKDVADAAYNNKNSASHGNDGGTTSYTSRTRFDSRRSGTGTQGEYNRNSINRNDTGKNTTGFTVSNYGDHAKKANELKDRVSALSRASLDKSNYHQASDKEALDREVKDQAKDKRFFGGTASASRAIGNTASTIKNAAKRGANSVSAGLSSLKKRVFGEEFDLTDSDTPTLDRYRNRAAGQSNRANHVKSSNRPGMHESIYSNNVARRANSSNRKK